MYSYWPVGSIVKIRQYCDLFPFYNKPNVVELKTGIPCIFRNKTCPGAYMFAYKHEFELVGPCFDYELVTVTLP